MIINCPECNKDISHTSKKCIHCGYVLKKSNKKPFIITACIILVVGLLILAITQCHGVRPGDVSRDVYNLGVDAIKITDKYMSGNMDFDDARKKLINIESKIETNADDAHVRDEFIGSLVGYVLVYMEFYEEALDSKDQEEYYYDMLLEQRNDLADELNYK